MAIFVISMVFNYCCLGFLLAFVSAATSLIDIVVIDLVPIILFYTVG